MIAIDSQPTTKNDAGDSKPSRKRLRKRPLERGEMNSMLCVASLTAIYLFFLHQSASVRETIDDRSQQDFRFHGFLDDAQDRKNKVKSNLSSGEHKEGKTRLLTDGQGATNKYLIFVGYLPGQGTGNIISGLLSAHLLGEEFNRVVCVQDYPTFTDLFDLADPVTMAKCPSIVSQAKFPPPKDRDHIRLINYGSPPDECTLQEKLNSDTPILFLTGNTYPRWPTVPDNYFFKYYKAKPKLLEALPYDPQSPPTTVVHLREPDNRGSDPRKGLDEVSLKILGDSLPRGADTYLVTNNVAYYERFDLCCQWSHPHWNTVVHSALSLEWGPNQLRKPKKLTATEDEEIKARQNLQMWADWYTLLTAKTVYHTHSDFSVSAIHWTNKVNSHSLQGTKNGRTLITVRESWWVDGETTPLVDRTRTAPGTAQLRLCRPIQKR